MVSSATYWLVLGITVPIFWLLPRGWRYWFLAVVSGAYLATLAAESVLAVSAWTVAFFLLAPYAGKGRSVRLRVLWTLVLGVTAFLVAFKHLPVVITAIFGKGVVGSVALPLGISYYSFKLIHYATEVARGNLREHSFPEFAAFMLLFPIFAAGPIERFDHFLHNLEGTWRSESMVYGLTRIVYGLIKKFGFADLVLEAASLDLVTPGTFFSSLAERPVSEIWLYVAATYLYIYLDFSAYSDMAIGCSRLYGINILENFNFPLVAWNIREFWRRWHMTLSNWCQSYIYLPVIGLYRQPLVALYATFLVMGLWHAATVERIAWGLYHATGVALYTVFQRYCRRHRWRLEHPLYRACAIPLTQAFICGSMTFLIADPHGGLYGSFRLLCKLLFIDLPA